MNPTFMIPRSGTGGIPVLRALFPEKTFPDPAEHGIPFSEAVAFIEKCQEVIRPSILGMKTAGWVFVEYARVYHVAGYPVIAVIRDIRDVLAEAPLPEWVGGEPGLNRAFRSLWKNLDLCDLWIRYEDFVAKPDEIFESVSKTLGCELTLASGWSADSVHHTMFKLGRHDMLRTGRISQEKVGIWKNSARAFAEETLLTAAMMGYGEG